MDRPAYLGQGRGRGQGGTPTNFIDIRSSNEIARIPGDVRNNSKNSCTDGKVGSADHVMLTSTYSTTDPKNLSAPHHSAKHGTMAKQFSDMSDSSEEEEIHDEEILMSTTKAYQDLLSGLGEHGTENQFLSDALQPGATVCLVCIESVKRSNAIWNCRNCGCIFHLGCIQKWANEGVGRQALAADGDITELSFVWHCPKCRHEYAKSECPTKYVCFCGKKEDPVFDPWIVPHSCGQRCLKPLRPECGHGCMLLCHPGPCPPCPKTILTKCHCERQGPEVRRCSKKTWSCGKRCLQALTCGHHECQAFCHPGNCPPCPETSPQPCLCGKRTSVRECAVPDWQCENVCGKALPCGEHTCERVCHEGDCGPCPRAGPRTCPCGKTSVSLPCTEDVPACADTCEKPLACGSHSCVQKCHYGSCQICLQHISKTCRCGRVSKEVACSQNFTCDFKCTNPRSCGKHPCKRKCCDGRCPPCEQMCNRTLNCRNHKCPSPCHSGLCYPCSATKEVACFCGAAKMTVPCGREKSTRPPRCKQLCKIRSECHHEEREPHRCHFGKCPTCRQICAKPLVPCGHLCSEKCHDHVPEVEEKPKFVKPWEANVAEKAPFKPKPCGPCQHPVEKSCQGEHVVEVFPCSKVSTYSCKRSCGRMLACENHTCLRECHLVRGASAHGRAGKNCQPCEEMCLKSRPVGCIHDCKLLCHPGSCPACEVHLKLDCHCKSIQLYILCNVYSSSSNETKQELLSCKGKCPKALACGHLCPKVCHPGPCADSKNCVETVKLKCPCKRKKKAFPCPEVVASDRTAVLLPCDERCRELLDKKRQEELEKIEQEKADELKRQQDELEKFERKRQGRKRKPRTVSESSEAESFLWKFRFALALSLLTVIAALAFGFYFR